MPTPERPGSKRPAGGTELTATAKGHRAEAAMQAESAVDEESVMADSAAGEEMDAQGLMQTLLTTVRSLATNLEAVKNELKSDMADLKKELKSDMADLKAELKSDAEDLKKELRVRIDPSTHAEVTKAKGNVVKPALGTHAGADATWTLVTYNNRFFALGAAHCALYFKAATVEEYTPVFLPLEFADLATKVYVSKDVDGTTPCRDIVMVELKSSPGSMKGGVSIDFTTTFEPNSLDLVSTIAVTSAFDLRGSAPERVKLESATSKHCFIFHVAQHEAGNSGALLWAMDEQNAAVAYGVFFGVDDKTANEENMLLRGVGVPLPRVEGDAFVLTNGDTMTSYDVDDTPLTKATYKYAAPNHMVHAVSVENPTGKVRRIKGHHCVFVKATFIMNGAAVCKSLGCGWEKE